MKIQIKILNKDFYRNKVISNYVVSGNINLNLLCCEDTMIEPGETKDICTGLSVYIGMGGNYVWPAFIEQNYVGLIIPHNELSTKGLILSNTIGIIDENENYQGEIIVQAWNRNNIDEEDYDCSYGCKSKYKITINAGDRIAQLIFIPFIKAQFEVVEEFTDKIR